MPHDGEPPHEPDALEGEIWSEDEEFGAPDERVQRPKPDLGEDWEEERGLDVDDVALADPELWAREEPRWVVEPPYTDEDLGTIRSGKEAEVRLLRRRGRTGSCLLAFKRFRPRAQRAFRREEDYRAGASLGDERVDRAVANRSRFGRDVLEYAWAYNEFPLMRTAWEMGVRVPYPVDMLDDGLTMEYVGDETAAAPRLADVRLEQDEAEEAFEEIVEGVRRLLDAYLVHADLSAFNVLWWEGRAWLIDFPQAVDVAKHPRGLEFLERDVRNVCGYFRRAGVERDPGDVLRDVLRTAPFEISVEARSWGL